MTALPSTPTVLVVTAEAGEPQLDSLRETVAGQTGVLAEHTIVSGLTEASAMRVLHAITTTVGLDYDWVLKLDADMELLNSTSIKALVDASNRNGCPARFTSPVLDFFTGTQINGVHLVRPSLVPVTIAERELRLDYWIMALPGRTLPAVKDPQVRHAYEPNQGQAFRFGYTRGRKMINEGPGSSHWMTLAHTLRARRRCPCEAHDAAVAGFMSGLGLAAGGPRVPPELRNDLSWDLLGPAIRSMIAEQRDPRVFSMHRSRYPSVRQSTKLLWRLARTDSSLFLRQRTSRLAQSEG